MRKTDTLISDVQELKQLNTTIEADFRGQKESNAKIEATLHKHERSIAKIEEAIMNSELTSLTQITLFSPENATQSIKEKLNEVNSKLDVHFVKYKPYQSPPKLFYTYSPEREYENENNGIDGYGSFFLNK